VNSFVLEGWTVRAPLLDKTGDVLVISRNKILGGDNPKVIQYFVISYVADTCVISMYLLFMCFVFFYSIPRCTLNDENMLIFLEIKMMLHNQNRIGGLSYPVQCIIITGMTFIADNQRTLQS
jgi:hypothetical protein